MPGEKLTDPMLEALGAAHRHGDLIRMDGGYWSYRGAPLTRSLVPKWYVATATIAGLVKRGLLDVANTRLGGRDWQRVALSEAGRQLVASWPPAGRRALEDTSHDR